MFTTTQIKLAAITLLAAGTLGSATAALAPVHLVFPDGARQDAWVEVATEVAIRFKDQANSTMSKDLRIKDLTSLFFYEPSEYTEAMSLFKGRKYAEALPKFEACAAAYKDTLEVVGNYSALSRYYAMECHRKLGNIEAMMKVREGFRKERLSREADRIQFDLYPLLEAVSKRSWEKVEAQAKQWLARNDLSGSQRAQAGYCLGMAHEQAGRIEDAMIAFGIGMTASCGEDETVIRESAIGALRTLNNDPLVKTAIKLYGTEHEADQSTGHLRLLEAGRLATVFPKRFGAGRALPPEFTPLLQYKKKEAAAEAPGK